MNLNRVTFKTYGVCAALTWGLTWTISAHMQGAELQSNEQSSITRDWREARDSFALALGRTFYPPTGIENPEGVLEFLSTLPDDERKSRVEQLTNILVAQNHLNERLAIQLIDSREARLPEELILPEEYSYFYADLIAVVASLQDRQTLRALVGAVATGGIAANAIAAFGPDAVPHLVDVITEGPLASQRLAAADLLAVMSAGKPQAFQGLWEAIKNAALAAARDEEPIVRREAVKLLGTVADADCRAALEMLATSDEFRATYRPGSPYIVREAAAQELQRIAQ